MINERKVKQKRLVLIISTFFFLIALFLNIFMNQSMFNYNLNVVPSIQNNSFFGSHAFISLMNLFSNLFNPILCAGYIVIFYLFSYRKIQILVFLTWFIFISVLLSILKEVIHQQRPYWIKDSGVQMLEWTCYTEYGCPSGHAMMGLVLIQFVIRFLARGFEKVQNNIYKFYVVGFIIQLIVIFSRICLGMHSINQVLFGLLLGVYSFIPYYLYAEKYILKMCFTFTKNYYRIYNVFILAMLILVFMSIEIVLTFSIHYDNEESWIVIESIDNCEGVRLERSFQYRCFQDCALIMASFGILYGFIFLRNPQNLMKIPNYKRKTLKFLAKIFLSLVIALIPIIIFLNPLWQKIQLRVDDESLLIWLLYCFGLFCGMLFLVIAPFLTHKFGLQNYSNETAIESEKTLSRPKSRQLILTEEQKKWSQNDSLQIPK